MKKLLIFGYGNPGRGDDAIGPLFVEQVSRWNREEISYLSDMQLLVEHVTDLHAHNEVIVVDADMTCIEPFEFLPIVAFKDESCTSHTLTPAGLLYVYQQIYQCDSPTTFLLRIRGYNFSLGEVLSEKAACNLNTAVQFITQKYL
ncbi:MAG: hydrogenase maturation protease [Nitrosomonas sp.]|jgi:hydrogenase maturation protease|nr:hydrogenase maturation protease [Nitrosomonas sp.]